MAVERIDSGKTRWMYEKSASFFDEPTLFNKNNKRDLIVYDLAQVPRYRQIEDFPNRPNLLVHSRMVSDITLDIGNYLSRTYNYLEIDTGMSVVLSHIHDITELTSKYGDIPFNLKIKMSDKEKRKYEKEEKSALKSAYEKYYYGDTSSIYDTQPIWGKDIGDKEYKIIYPGKDKYATWEECKISFDEFLLTMKYIKDKNVVESQIVKIADVMDAFYEMTHLYFCSGKVVETYDDSFEKLEKFKVWPMLKENDNFGFSKSKIPKLSELKKLPHIENKNDLYDKSVIKVINKYPQFYKYCLILSLCGALPNHKTFPDWYGGYYERIMERRNNSIATEDEIDSKYLKGFKQVELYKQLCCCLGQLV